MMNDIIFLTPVFKNRVWGGRKLNTDWKYPIVGSRVGECWAVSAHKSGSSIVCGGLYDGYKLSDLWKDHPELFNNVDNKDFPLLTKIIAAEDNLSIQVHPDDDYANLREKGAQGKEECWYIVSARAGSRLVIGHNASTKDEFKQMVDGGRWSELIREIPVKKGDFVTIPPGTVHSIKGGIQLLETQQNSDITYRLYDYDRLSDGTTRELHLDKCIDVVTVPALPGEKSVTDTNSCNKNEAVELVKNAHFTVLKYDITDSVDFVQDKDYMIFSVVEGEGTISVSEKTYDINKGIHFILPYKCGEIRIEGKLTLIASYK